MSLLLGTILKLQKKSLVKIFFCTAPFIRSREACYKSSHLAISLAKYNTRLHVLHISTKEELDLFSNDICLSEKRITSEVCIHHLTFTDQEYEHLGPWIKWNPAVKSKNDKSSLESFVNNRIDIVASDHAPHTISEKKNKYLSSPSGGPLVQHSLPIMLEHMLDGRISKKI